MLHIVIVFVTDVFTVADIYMIEVEDRRKIQRNKGPLRSSL